MKKSYFIRVYSNFTSVINTYNAILSQKYSKYNAYLSKIKSF